MTLQLEMGKLSVSSEVFISIIGYVATKCFGVKGMAARNLQDGLVHLLQPNSLAKGVKYSYNAEQERLDIDMHIVVEYGVNIPALCKSIMKEVRYNVEKMTGLHVGSVNVFVDSIMAND